MKHEKLCIDLIIFSLIIVGMTDYSQLLYNGIALDEDLLHSSTVEKTIIGKEFPINYLPKHEIYTNYTSHSPIVIFNDENLTDYGFPGSGTEDDPYRIEGYNITSSHTGIKIYHTTKHILIQNCYIRGYSAISVDNTSYGTIIIHNNWCEKSYFALIRLSNSDGAIISSNYCYQPGELGACIGVSCSKDVMISNNIIDVNTVYSPGIYCSRTENITVKGNVCMNSRHSGIYFDEVINSTIINNTCIDNFPSGISLWSFRPNKNIVIANNTCTNLQSFSAKRYLKKVVRNMKVSNIFGLTFQDLYVSNSKKYGGGISVIDDNRNITIIDNVCSNMSVGISLVRNNNSALVIDNYVSQCYSGITLYDLNNSIITHNTLVGNSYGVYIAIGHNYDYGKYVECICYNNTIHHNNFTDNVPDNGTSQAYDAGVNNTWYDPQTLEGNYWSDWNGTGVYPIDGPAGSFDPYPLPRPHNSLFHYWWFDLSILLSSFILIFSIFIAFRRLKIFQK